jgi:hypothetical protein
MLAGNMLDSARYEAGPDAEHAEDQVGPEAYDLYRYVLRVTCGVSSGWSE